MNDIEKAYTRGFRSGAVFGYFNDTTAPTPEDIKMQLMMSGINLPNDGWIENKGAMPEELRGVKKGEYMLRFFGVGAQDLVPQYSNPEDWNWDISTRSGHLISHYRLL